MIQEAIELAEYIRDLGYMPEQVQDFYPTPSTLSTCMYYTGLNPLDMQPVYVPRNPHEKAMQRALLQYRRPENYALVKEALIKAGREELIGYGPKCLLHPARLPRRRDQSRQEKKQDAPNGEKEGARRRRRQSATCTKRRSGILEFLGELC